MYLLIIGSPRSGTTLLASLIGMHSDVAMLIEDRNFAIKKLTGKKVLANKLCIPHQAEILKRSTFIKKRLQRFGFLKNYPTSKYNIEDYLKLEGIKIVCIIRDAGDVVDSIMKRGKKQQKIAEGRWKRAVEIIHELYTKHPEIVSIVSYEDLVTEPEKLIKNICSFIGIEFEQRMLEGYKYNILYPGETGIDKTRAFKSKSEVLNNDHLKSNAKDLYDKLLHVKTTPGA